MSDLVIRVAANISELRANLQDGVTQLETWKSAMSAATNAFDGSRVVGQASAAAKAIENVGGVSALTASEQTKANQVFTEAAAKLELMGKGGSAQAQTFKDLAAQTAGATEQTSQFAAGLERVGARLAEYFAFREVLNFSKELLESASALEDLSRATGISTDGLQKLTYVGQQYGLTQEMIVRAVEQFSSKLAGGDESAAIAVQRLGLNVQQLIAMGPEKAFIAFADAAARVSDPMDKAAIYTEAFGGRLGKLLMSLGDVSKALDQVPTTALIDEDTIRRAHDFDVELQHITTSAKALVTDAIGGLVSGTGLLGTQYDLLGQSILAVRSKLEDHSAALKEHGKDVVLEIDHETQLQNVLTSLRTAAMEPLTVAQRAAVEELNHYHVSLKDMASLLDVNVAAIHAYIDAEKASAEESKRAADEDIAETKKRFAEWARGAEATTKLMNEFDDLRVKHGGLANEIAIADIHKWAADLTATMQKAHADTAEFYTMLAAVTHEKLSAVGLDWAEMSKYGRDRLYELYQNAQATFEYVVANVAEFDRAAVDHFRHLRDVALDAFHAMQNGADQTAGHVASIGAAADAAAAKLKAAKEAADAAAKAEFDHLNPKIAGVQTYDLATDAGRAYFMQQNPAAAVYADKSYFATHTLEDAVKAGLVNFYAGYAGHFPTFAGGVTDFEGGIATVHKDEMLVNLPKHTDVIPKNQVAGALGGTNVTVNVHGHVLGTSTQQLGAIVEAALIQAARARGDRYPITRAN